MEGITAVHCLYLVNNYHAHTVVFKHVITQTADSLNFAMCAGIKVTTSRLGTVC